MSIKGLTATMIFEASALNRDEKIGGNILSIKKLSTSRGIYSFIGRPAVRYSLFTSLYELFNWQEAPVKLAKDKVIQFDFPEANIVTYPEMDFFGYMCTSKGEDGPSIIRKAPLGITKAISLEPWQADMAFYANHDMLRRLREMGEAGEPNPYQKEEHYSLYKVSFTIDLSRLGYQELFYTALPDMMEGYLDTLNKVNPNKVDTGEYSRQVDQVKEWYEIVDDNKALQGYIGVEKAKKHTRMVFIVDEKERQRRLLQLLTVIKNGIMYHSSTENYGLIPLFIVMGSLRLPVPLFHSALRMQEGKLEASRLNQALENEYIIKFYTGGPMSTEILIEDKKKEDEWSKFLQTMNLNISEVL
jgi:CRISPR-associated protein Cst2